MARRRVGGHTLANKRPTVTRRRDADARPGVRLGARPGGGRDASGEATHRRVADSARPANRNLHKRPPRRRRRHRVRLANRVPRVAVGGEDGEFVSGLADGCYQN